MSIDRVAQLKTMHLFGMAAAWHEWQTEYSFQQKPVMSEVWLGRLIEAEQADRQARSLNYQLTAARFPIHRDLMSLIGKKRHCNKPESNNCLPLASWIKPTT